METEIEKEENTEIKLDRKSKILFIVLGILIAVSVAATYWRYMARRDYIIQAQIDCDPETQNCFIWKCDPMSLEEGEKCTGNPDNDIWHYKIFNRNAKNIPNCDPKDENCAAYVCAEGEADCSEELCMPENVPEGEECNDPEQYLIDNPPEEEGCAEDDEECAAEIEEECSPDDEECLNQAEQEDAQESDSPAAEENTDETIEEVAPQRDAIPQGIEPM